MNIQKIIFSHKKITIPIIVLLFILSLLPVVIKYFAIDRLDKAGAKNVQIKDIDLNFFTGEFEIEGFSIKENDRQHVSLPLFNVNISILSLLRKRIYIESITVDGLDIAIEQKDKQLLAGISVPLATEKPERPDIENKTTGPLPDVGIGTFTFTNASITYESTELSSKIKINNLSLIKLLSWKPATASQIIIDALINDGSLHADISLNAFSDQKQVDAEIKLNEFSLEPYAFLASEVIDEAKGVLTIDTRLSLILTDSGIMNVKQSGKIAVNNISGNIDAGRGRAIKLNDVDLAWKGKTGVEMSLDGKLAGLNLEGEFSNDHLRLKLSEPDASIEHSGLVWKGTVSIDNPDDLNSLQENGAVSLQNLLVANDEIGIEALKLEKFDVKSLTINGLDHIQAGSVSTRQLGFAVLDRKKYKTIPERLMKYSEIIITDVQLLNQSHIIIDTIEVKDLAAILFRNSKEEMPVIKMLSRILTPKNVLETKKKSKDSSPSDQETGDAKQDDKALASASTEDKVPEEGEKKIGIEINSFFLSGTNTVKVIDVSVKPNFERSLTFETLSLKNIDNSDITNSSDLSLKVLTDVYSYIDIKGKVRPFHPKVDMDLTGKISNVSLPMASPYVSRYLGYNIKTGSLKADFTFKVDAGKLNVTNTVTLNNIKLTPDEQEKIDKLSKQLTMPLDTALSILRDNDNNVTLSIPITGDIGHPDFDLNNIIYQAMGKALKMGSVSMLKNILQPYGTAVMIAQWAYKGGKYATKIRIDPIEFDIGSLEMREESKDYLAIIEKVLAEKEALRLTICGVAIPGDLPELDHKENIKTFHSFADQRAHKLRDHFIELGISPERIFLCNPEIDIDEDAFPRVEVSL